MKPEIETGYFAWTPDYVVTRKPDAPYSVEQIVAAMNKLSDDDRMKIMGNFCRYCGCNDPRCSCWNDE